LDRQGRGKRSIAIDLKKREGLNIVRRLCSSADVLIEPFRAGHFIYL
jgi:alpha-methylacyl-CoA racemase